MVGSRRPGARRIHLAVAAALTVVSSLALAPAALAVPGCPSFADERGDAAPLGGGSWPRSRTEVRDPSLDITNVRYSVVDGKFSVAITVARYADRPTLAWGHAFEAAFLAPRYGREVVLFNGKTPSREVDGAVLGYAWISVDGRILKGSASALQMTVDGDVVTLAFPVAFLDEYVGGLAGREVVPGQSRTWGLLPGPYGTTYDVANPPAEGFRFTVAACR